MLMLLCREPVRCWAVTSVIILSRGTVHGGSSGSSPAHLLLLLLQRLGALHLGEHLLRARPLLRRAVCRQVLQMRNLLPPLRDTRICVTAGRGTHDIAVLAVGVGGLHV